MILWTILTAALFLVLLIFLSWAVGQIYRALVGVRRSLEQIAWGVRAIETETGMLPPNVAGVAGSLAGIHSALAELRDHFAAVVQRLPKEVAKLGA